MLDALPIAHPTGGVTIIEKTKRRVISSAWSGSNHTGPDAVVNMERPAVGDPATVADEIGVLRDLPRK